MFLNDCVWAVFCLSEDGEKFNRIPVNLEFAEHTQLSRLCKPDFKISQLLPHKLTGCHCG